MRAIAIRNCLVFVLVLAPPATLAQGDWFYPMQPGDTIWDLSHRFLEDWRHWLDVKRRNGVSNDREMPPGTQVRFPVEWLRTEAASVQVLHVRGDVTARLSRGDAPVPLKPGMTLFSGDSVETAANSNTTLKFADGTRLLIQENSSLQLVVVRTVGGEISDAEVLLEEGNTESRANPDGQPGARFQLQTPVATAAVRGTIFRADAEQRRTMRVSVTDGRVSVSNERGRTLVPERFGTITEAGKPPEPPRPLLNPPDLSGIAAVQHYLPIELSWPQDPRAGSYRVQVASDPDFQQLVHDEVSETSRLAIADLPDGEFFMRVRPIDRRGIQGLDAARSFSVDARPFPPFTQYPREEGSVRQDQLRFEWTIPEGISRYRLEVARDGNFAEPVIKLELTSAEHTPATAPEPGTYGWRVASLAAGGVEGPPSQAVSFELRATPASPELEPPELEERFMTFRWYGLEDERYEVELASDWQFDEIVQRLVVVGPSASFQRPLPGVYFVRARGIDAEGVPGPWGPGQKFQIEPPSWVFPTIGVVGVLLLLL